MLTSLPAIGQLRDRIRDWFGNRAVRQLDRAIRAGDYDTVFELIQRSYLGSAASAFDLHGEFVDLEPFDTERLAEFGRAAERYAAAATRRSAGGVLLPPEVQEQYADLIVDESIATGYEYGARQAAVHSEEPLEWKTWTRIFPAKVPRDWHDQLNGHTIERNAMFTLPGGDNVGQECNGPHAWEDVDDPGEWINCGHALIYTPAADWTDVLH